MYISFIVNKNGAVTSVTIMRDNVGFGCAEEAIGVLENMPQWTPGMVNDHAVNVKMIMPIAIQNEE
jgi:protein TonB